MGKQEKGRDSGGGFRKADGPLGEAQTDAGTVATPVAGAGRKIAKHQVVFDYLYSSIQSEAFKPGDRLPSEAELGKKFDASRITVAKAVLELQRMNLVTRRPGAGTHVQARQRRDGYTFGLLIPELGLTEIFEPICHGMMRSPFARPDSLLWGNASGAAAGREKGEEAEQMAQYFIGQRVSGIFFAPLELISDRDAANRRIIRALERARIPMVLLDRDYLPYPERSGHDLVGIDNRRTAFQVTEHLIKLGFRNLVFLAELNSAATIEARITGFYEALYRYRMPPEGEVTRRGNPLDAEFVRKMVFGEGEFAGNGRPGGIVCANDVTAARLMQTLQPLGVRVPEDLRIVGIDDVRYASLLPVPLTTMHQNCAAIGVIAMATMLERLEHPDLPTREILLPTRLVVRRSCGAYLNE